MRRQDRAEDASPKLAQLRSDLEDLYLLLESNPDDKEDVEGRIEEVEDEIQELEREINRDEDEYDEPEPEPEPDDYDCGRALDSYERRHG